MLPVDADRSGLCQLGLQLVEYGKAEGIQLRLVGSVGVIAASPAAERFFSAARLIPRDIDLVCRSRDRTALRALMSSLGFGEPQGGAVPPYLNRSVFVGEKGAQQVRVDVYFDSLDFVHRINLGDEFDLPSISASLGALLMSKLQMRRRGRSDLIQLGGLLIQLNSEDAESQNRTADAIGSRASRDFRCWRDFKVALAHIVEYSDSDFQDLTAAERLSLLDGAEMVTKSLESAEVGIGWWFGRVLAAMRLEPSEPEDWKVGDE